MRTWTLGVLLAVAALVTAPLAWAQTVVEQRIAAIRPCSSLAVSKTMLGQRFTIGIDRLKSVSLINAQVTMAGNEVTLTFAGSLACRTSDSAAFKGDASVAVAGQSALDLGSCTIRALSIRLTGAGGTFGEVVRAAWDPLIRPKLEAEAAAMLRQACADFSGRR